jgi:hypothetical protein
MLDRLEGHAATLGEKTEREAYTEATMQEDPWHVTKCPEWNDPEDPDTLTGAVALYQMRINRYESTRKRAIDLKQFMLQLLPQTYRDEIDACESPGEIYLAAHDTLIMQQDVMAATLDQEYASLRGRRTGLSADQFCREMLVLYRKGIQYQAPVVQYIKRWIVEDLVHYWPTFHAQYTNNRNLDAEDIIQDFQQSYPSWVASESAKTLLGIGAAAVPSNIAAPNQNGRPPRTRRNNPRQDFKPSVTCVCGGPHRYDDCYYFIVERRPSWWKPKHKPLETIRKALKDLKLREKIERTIKR